MASRAHTRQQPKYDLWPYKRRTTGGSITKNYRRVEFTKIHLHRMFESNPSRNGAARTHTKMWRGGGTLLNPKYPRQYSAGGYGWNSIFTDNRVSFGLNVEHEFIQNNPSVKTNKQTINCTHPSKNALRPALPPFDSFQQPPGSRPSHPNLLQVFCSHIVEVLQAGHLQVIMDPGKELLELSLHQELLQPLDSFFFHHGKECYVWSPWWTRSLPQAGHHVMHLSFKEQHQIIWFDFTDMYACTTFCACNICQLLKNLIHPNFSQCLEIGKYCRFSPGIFKVMVGMLHIGKGINRWGTGEQVLTPPPPSKEWGGGHCSPAPTLGDQTHDWKALPSLVSVCFTLRWLFFRNTAWRWSKNQSSVTGRNLIEYFLIGLAKKKKHLQNRLSAIGLGVSRYFHILCTENTVTHRDCSENRHVTLCIQH